MSCLLPLLFPVFLQWVWVRTLTCCKRLCVQAFVRYTHRSETPTNSSYFIRTLASKWPRLLVPLTALFRRVTSTYMSIILGIKVHGPWPWPWPQTPLALALKTSGLGLDNAVLLEIQRQVSFGKPGDKEKSSCAWCSSLSHRRLSIVLMASVTPDLWSASQLHNTIWPVPNYGA